MKAIFVDRDGVINKDPGDWTKYNYVTDPKDLQFIPGALEALRLLNLSGIKVIVISNQAGVSKGYFSKKELDEVDSKMIREARKAGGDIERSYYCVHKDEDNCNCRKPKPGLLEMAARQHGIDLKDTYFVGDSLVDAAAGAKAGCKTIFVLSGKTTLAEMKRWNHKPDYVFKDLLEAVKWILAKERRRGERAEKRRAEPRRVDE